MAQAAQSDGTGAICHRSLSPESLQTIWSFVTNLRSLELDLDEADIEKLHGLLEKRGIELVEEYEPAAAADLQEALDARPGKAETPLDLTPDTTTDLRSPLGSPFELRL